MNADALNLPLPERYTITAGADTGTYCSAVIAAVADDPLEVLVLEEFPNYRYVSGEIELLDYSIGDWCDWYRESWERYSPRQSARAWCDPNTQFRSEYATHRVTLLLNKKSLDVRTDIARSYINAKKQCVWLAPWLDVLPYEIERAAWPRNETSAGKFTREKRNDHTLDCLEHLLSRRPRGRVVTREKRDTFLDRMFKELARTDVKRIDRHLGRY